MADGREEAQFRQHLAEMRRAASGLGGDIEREIANLGSEIDRWGKATGKSAKYLREDIEDRMAALGKSLDEGARRVPQHIANAGAAIGSGAAYAAGATRDAVLDAGHRAKEGTKNAFAAAAGVRRTPMREWSPPSSGESAPTDDES